MDTDAIGSLLGSLTVEDMAALKDLAGSLLGGEKKQEEKPPESSSSEFDFESMTKLMSVLGALGSANDERTALLHSLKPFLSDARRKKADEAARMLKLIGLLPTLKDILGNL